jgi:16S rRNA (uracil1498-N3)-methyltransferase
MHRFFIPPEAIQNGIITFPENIARQISKVLRLQDGNEVTVLDGSNIEYLVKLDQVSTSLVKGHVTARGASSGEPSIRVHLCIALTQREKFEWILQKCTEVGVASFTPVITSRSLIQNPAEVVGKYPRWHNIIREAAEQSHRGLVPTLNPVSKFENLLKDSISNTKLRLFFWEEEHGIGLKSILGKYSGSEVCLIIGPEGGLSAGEAEMAKTAGYQSVSLGTRILRMETAAVVATALVLYELG